MVNPPESYPAVATLITNAERGHTLNRRQVLSPDRFWAVFDTRNDDAQIGTTRSIERVHLTSALVEVLYQVAEGTVYGPGVGAAAYHPQDDKVIFIHGLHNCSSKLPYGVARRFGAIWDSKVTPAEYRIGQSERADDRLAPLNVPLGVLSGGSHAHSWSPNGSRISFTYDDALRPTMPRTVGFMTNSASVNQMVAEMFATSTQSRNQDAESFAGAYSSFLLLEPDPNLGIRKALEECWVGNHSIAFLGMVESKRGEEILEIFVADLPSDEEIVDSLRTMDHRQGWPLLPGINLRRLTYLESRVFPGVQGPRHWLTASPTGESIYFLLRDPQGVVQVAQVGVESGDVRVLTELECGVEGQISVDRTGDQLAFVSDGLVCTLSLRTGQVARWVERGWREGVESPINTKPLPYEGSYVGSVHFIGDRRLLVNRYLRLDSGIFLQILMLEI
ncbi:DUF3748 domain-containing protein [Pirellulaceae bacterium SH449]